MKATGVLALPVKPGKCFQQALHFGRDYIFTRENQPMNNNARYLIISLCLSILALVLVNLVSFGIRFGQMGFSATSYGYKNFGFQLNGRGVGLVWGTLESYAFVILITALLLRRFHKKGKINLESPETKKRRR